MTTSTPNAFSDKSILITGCSSGIGYSTAKILSARGYRVFASARKPEDVDRLKSEGLNAVELDLANSDSIQCALQYVLEQSDGKLYSLFNNGAYGQAGAVEDLRRDVLREQFETNLFGTVELTNLVIPIMRKQGFGRIIQCSSILGFVALKYRGAYNASKYALEGINDTLRQELVGSNITVSSIQPGPISTRFRANSMAMYKKNIVKETSFHKETYQSMEERLQKEGPAAPFTLPPNAVTKKVIHALESKRPKNHYPVTFPTYLFAILKRILPSRTLDKILSKF
ncbi:MAG: SDR family oxidoreductase [Thiotrichales bacterium]|nr:SDR family oxidoreductase [Thiotrichales bacterium]